MEESNLSTARLMGRRDKLVNSLPSIPVGDYVSDRAVTIRTEIIHFA